MREIKLRLEVDWRAYFEDFNARHGGNPVLHGSQFLYGDAWRWGMSSHGPGVEIPPPTDGRQLRRLRRFYWRSHYSRLSLELREWKHTHRYLSALASTLEGEIRVLREIAEYDEDGKQRMVTHSLPVDFSDINRRIGELEAEVSHCLQEYRKCRVS